MALNLTAGTEVARSGGTVSWTGLAGSPPYTAGTFAVGDKSKWARFQIVPTAPLGALPPILALLIAATVSPSDTGLNIDDDSIYLGSVAAPFGSNAGLDAPVGGSRAYLLSTSPTALADLNASLVYLWIGYRADPATYNGGAYSFGYSGTGTHNNAGTLTAWAGSPPFAVDTGNLTNIPNTGSEVGTLTVTASGPDGLMWATVTIATSGSAIGVAASGDVTLSDSFGGSNSTSGASPLSISLSTPQLVRINVSGGTGTANVTASAVSDSTAGPSHCRLQASASVSAVAASPAATTLTISAISLGYDTSGGGGGLILFQGTPQENEEMTTRYIGDVVTFYAKTFVYATGAPVDADSLPTYRIYEETTGTPIETGTMAFLDAANTNGLYTGTTTLTALAGYEVGRSYFVEIQAAVGAVAMSPDADGGSWVVRDVPSTATSVSGVPAAVWSFADPGDAAGRATTLGGMLRQIWSYCFNRNAIQGNLQAVYRDNSSSTMLQGSQSASDTQADRGKMS